MNLLTQPYANNAGSQVQLRHSDTFRSDVQLIQSLWNLIAPSYEEPSSLLNRELNHCTHLYLGHNQGELICFFLVAWEFITLNGSQHPAVYMGLSATRQDRKNSGVVRQVYVQALKDALAWENELATKLIVWATTATPTSYLFSQTLLENVQPLLDGTFDSKAAEIAKAIRHQQDYGINQETPFMLRGVAQETHYSASELHRIERVTTSKNFGLFRQLNISEHLGDRLLIVGQTRNRI